MKKIISGLIIILTIYTIYNLNKNNQINYLSIGDSISMGIDSNQSVNHGYNNYIVNYLSIKNKLETYNNFSVPGLKIKDLENKLDTDWIVTEKNKYISLKKCLREAEFITLAVGTDELITKISLLKSSINLLTNEEIKELGDDYINKLDSLLKKIRKCTNKKIVFINYYPNYDNKKIERLYAYLNIKLKKITKNYNIDYLDISNNQKNYPLNPLSFYPNPQIYQQLATKIIENYLQYSG